jgi:hypothetical protein
MDGPTYLDLCVENAELRRDLVAANARPVILWTVIMLTLVAVFFGGGAFLSTPTVLHDDCARMPSDSGRTVAP